MMTLIHIGMYLAPIESVMELSTSETAKKDDKSVLIPKHWKLIRSVSDSQVSRPKFGRVP